MVYKALQALVRCYAYKNIEYLHHLRRFCFRCHLCCCRWFAHFPLRARSRCAHVCAWLQKHSYFINLRTSRPQINLSCHRMIQGVRTCLGDYLDQDSDSITSNSTQRPYEALNTVENYWLNICLNLVKVIFLVSQTCLPLCSSCQ